MVHFMVFLFTIELADAKREGLLYSNDPALRLPFGDDLNIPCGRASGNFFLADSMALRVHKAMAPMLSCF
jgi:hypothetical protein